MRLVIDGFEVCIAGDPQSDRPLRRVAWAGYAAKAGALMSVSEEEKAEALALIGGASDAPQHAARLAENVAAISGEFHKHAGYQSFYDRHADEVSGFPGIWRLCADAGEVFTYAEAGQELPDWIEAIDQFVAALFAFEDVPAIADMQRIARRIIEAQS